MDNRATPSPTGQDEGWPSPVRSRRAVAAVDLVESVRLLNDFEADVIERWRRLVVEVRDHLLPAHGGRLVKSLGDGMLLEFASVVGAINAALALNKMIATYNVGRPAAAAMHLRFGIHEADIVVDQLDVYGAGVNLAVRLATLAGPREIVVSPAARSAVIDQIDVDVEDLGECYLKHFAEPQRAYRVGPLGDRSLMWSGTHAGVADRVTVAVIPFPTSGDDSSQLLGEVLADDLIARLSHLPQLQVVSRLSTTVFRQRDLDLQTLAKSLGCQYVVYGTCVVNSQKLRLRAQVVDCGDASVISAEGYDGRVETILGGDSELVDLLTEQVCHSLIGAETRRASTLPLPSLRSYTILLGAISMMHRLSRQDFERSRDMLHYLVERHPRATAPRAWLGKWHVMRVSQGWSPNPMGDAGEARSIVRQALELEPEHPLALSIDGLVCAYVNKDLATAGARYESALRVSPSEGLAWLFQSALHSYAGEGQLAVECATRAHRLSPLDPMKYYYDNFLSLALLAADDFAGAIRYGRRSLKANRTHGSTLRILAIAQVMAGFVEEARATLAEALRVEPGFNTAKFMERYPGALLPQAARYVAALREAGLPN